MARSADGGGRRYATGCRKDPYDPRDYQVQHFLTAAPTREHADHRGEMPPIFDQGNAGTCVACATGYYDKGFQEHRERGWSYRPGEHRFSPLFIYSQRADHSGDNGMNIREAMKIVRAEGVCPLAEMPYDPGMIDVPPSPEQVTAARPFRARSFARLTTIPEIERYLYDSVMVAGLLVHQSFMDAPDGRIPMPAPGDPFVGGHALCFTGFDSRRRELYFANSWGPAWGESGFGTISYDVFQALVMDVWGMVDAPDL